MSDIHRSYIVGGVSLGERYNGVDSKISIAKKIETKYINRLEKLCIAIMVFLVLIREFVDVTIAKNFDKVFGILVVVEIVFMLICYLENCQGHKKTLMIIDLTLLEMLILLAFPIVVIEHTNIEFSEIGIRQFLGPLYGCRVNLKMIIIMYFITLIVSVITFFILILFVKESRYILINTVKCLLVKGFVPLVRIFISIILPASVIFVVLIVFAIILLLCCTIDMISLRKEE